MLSTQTTMMSQLLPFLSSHKTGGANEASNARQNG
jgi:hypothetical protein